MIIPKNNAVIEKPSMIKRGVYLLNQEKIKLKEFIHQEYALKKEKLFNAGDINKMEINTEDRNIDRQRLTQDKAYAFEHICIKDTKELERLNKKPFPFAGSFTYILTCNTL